MASSQDNPWATSGSYVSTGRLHRALKVAENTCYNGFQLNDVFNSERGEPTVENCESLIQIKYLKEISKLDDKINKV